MKGKIEMLVTSMFLRAYMGLSSIITFSFFRYKKAQKKLIVIRNTGKSISSRGNVTIANNRILQLNTPAKEKLRVLESSKVN